MKLFSNKKNSFFFFLILMVLWGSLFFVLPDFLIYPTKGFKGFFYTMAHWALVCVPLVLIFYAIAINKYVFAIIFPLLVLLGSIIGFYSYFYKATLTPMILDAALHNDIGTSMDVMPALLFVYILLSMAAAIFAVIIRFKTVEMKQPFVHLVVLIVAFYAVFSLSERTITSFYQHFPFSLYYNFSEYNKLHQAQDVERKIPDIIRDYRSDENLTIVFVLGESLRADHLALNGYHRNTTPRLSKRENIISFPHIYSQYTYTNPSVAHIMTRADSANTGRAWSETSFVPLFKSSGFYTAWVANQEPAKSYITFMKECDTLIFAHPEKSVYTYSSWLDEDLLQGYHFLHKLNYPNKLLILHTIGSHWYYNNHYSAAFEKYKPVTRSKIVSQNSTDELVNSYDNTVLYTDFFLDSVISTLVSSNAIVIYLSDHGESLGEDGSWLHASNNPALRNPACIIWCSDSYITKHPNKFAALQANKEKRYRTDFLFHSILSAGSVPSTVIEKQYNIFE